MSDRSAIEWTDASWNPIRARLFEIQDDGSGKERIGWHCENVSEGCRNCYAERINMRLGTGFEFKPGNLRGRPGYHGGGIDRPELFLDEAVLTLPLRWKRPRKIFVCSMTDLFADFVKDEWIDEMFEIAGQCDDLERGHQLQILTKRAPRMLDYMRSERARRAWNRRRLAPEAWPPRNIWLGISCERQQEADERIPLLLQTPAAVRFISAEPLIAPLNLMRLGKNFGGRNALTGLLEVGTATMLRDPLPGLDWVIVGGESGPNARPMHPDWARALRDQCEAAGVPFFFKQWGEWGDFTDDPARARPECEDRIVTKRGRVVGGGHPRYGGMVHEAWRAEGCAWMARVGKKSAGRLLDGKEHNEFPACAVKAEAA